MLLILQITQLDYGDAALCALSALRGRAGPGFGAARQKGRKRIGESGAAFKGNEKTFRRICKIFAPNIVNFTNTILK